MLDAYGVDLVVPGWMGSNDVIIPAPLRIHFLSNEYARTGLDTDGASLVMSYPIETLAQHGDVSVAYNGMDWRLEPYVPEATEPAAEGTEEIPEGDLTPSPGTTAEPPPTLQWAPNASGRDSIRVWRTAAPQELYIFYAFEASNCSYYYETHTTGS